MESKAYHAALPSLSNRQAEALSMWASDNCWRSALARDRRHALWVAIREQKRTKPMWARHVKQVLDVLAIDTRPLETGDWLRLCSLEEADTLIKRMCSESTRAAGSTRTTVPAADPETKIIDLSANTTVARRKGMGATTKPKATKIEVLRE